MLETEIKNLTSAIKALNENLMAIQQVAATDQPCTEVSEEKPAESKDDSPIQKEKPGADYTSLREKAQSECLRLVRADRTNKIAIADWLNDNGVTTIRQLADERVADLVDFLGKL